MFKFESDEPASAPVEIGDKKFIIFEPSSAAAARYRNFLAAARTKPDGKMMEAAEWAEAKYQGLNEADAVLVAGCLFEQTPAGYKSVELSWVQKLPDRITKPLYKWANRFIDDAEDGAKNGQGGGDASSSSLTS